MKDLKGAGGKFLRAIEFLVEMFRNINSLEIKRVYGLKENLFKKNVELAQQQSKKEHKSKKVPKFTDYMFLSLRPRSEGEK
jgi:hypothetical protein